MKRRGAAARFISAVLGAAVFLASFAPEAAAVVGKEISTHLAASPRIQSAPAIDPLVLTPITPTAMPSAAPALLPPAASPVEALTQVARPLQDPSIEPAAHLGRVYDDSAARMEAAEVAIPAGAPHPAALQSASGGPLSGKQLPPPVEWERHSPRFPLWLAGLSAAAGLVVKGVMMSATVFTAQSGISIHPTVSGALGMAGVVALGAMGVSTLAALAIACVDAVVFVWVVRHGRQVTDEQFYAYVKDLALKHEGIANAVDVISPHRPQGKIWDFTFAFTARGQIWIRPELVAYPHLFQQILLHELHHWRTASTRPPSARGFRGFTRYLFSETGARLAEFRGATGLNRLKIYDIDRALRQVQGSLRLGDGYDVLVLNPNSSELANPKLYQGLSGGAAKAEIRSGVDALEALRAASGKGYQATVLGHAASLLPESQSKDFLRLETALRQLDSLNILALRQLPRVESFTPGSADTRGYLDLAEKARRLRETGASPKALESFRVEIRRFWQELSVLRLKGVGVTEAIGGLYASVRDHGWVFLPFAPEEHGVSAWENLLRYWEAEDGGRFNVDRVDFEDGGHMLVLRKIEARVALRLRARQNGGITTSIHDATDPRRKDEVLRVLAEAGFGDQREFFAKQGVIVQRVLGADVGRQEIYITVPRRNADAFRNSVSASAADIEAASHGFELHLMDSGPLQKVPPVHELGIGGKDFKIMWVGTGGDTSHEDFSGRLRVAVMVPDEGPEDWRGHESLVAGISISSNATFLGMAKEALGLVAKVFSRDRPTASENDIKAAGVVASQRGFDAVNLSLGGRGKVFRDISDFWSDFTRHKNAAGEYPIVVASGGNSGPFDQRFSSPGDGPDVLGVAAAAKSLDDGRPEIGFFSSPGFVLRPGYWVVRRWLLKPNIVGIGGDVGRSSNIYKDGVYATKSKDAPPSPSDLSDGRHTGISGTSMAAPAVAGIALLVKFAMKMLGALTGFVAENLPFVVRAVLMRSATDLGVPAPFQGPGLVNAWAAVQLVGEAQGKMLRSGFKRFLGPRSVPAEGWDWVKRLKAVADAEDRAYKEVEVVEEGGGAAETDSTATPLDRVASSNAAAADALKRFNAVRDHELPGLLTALKDPVWLVRYHAAFVLMNFRAPASLMPLMEAALNDSDARVRQVAFFALAEIPTHAVDVMLAQAVNHERWDTGVYAAYALARHGDFSGTKRLIQELSNPDKSARYTASWLLGQVALQAGPVKPEELAARRAEAEGLAARVRDRAERTNTRHVAAAALSYFADAIPEALSDSVVTNVLDAVGFEDLPLTDTAKAIFSVAGRSREFVARMRREPLKPIVADFVVKNRSASSERPLAEMVQMLARMADIPLDAPTPASDPNGAGVRGVDSVLGPVDLILTPPEGRGPKSYADDSAPDALARAFAEGGLDAATLARYESVPRVALPVSGTLSISVPAHKLRALSFALRQRGFDVRAASPEYPLANTRASGEGTLLNIAEGEGRPEIPAVLGSLVRVRASAGISEARVMEALELLAERAQGQGPIVVAVTVGAPRAASSPLWERLGRFRGQGLLIVVGAGDAGPNLNTAAPVSGSGRVVVVGAASKEGALQFYSGRGAAGAPRVTWVEAVDSLAPGQEMASAEEGKPAPTYGTGAAAERAAEKLARLLRAMKDSVAAQGRAMPENWDELLIAAATSALSPMPAHAAHEVGAGLARDEDEPLAHDGLRRSLSSTGAAESRR